MAMFREDRILLADLKSICDDASRFVLGYLSGDLSTEAESAYALRLIDVGERLLTHARTRKGIILEAHPQSQVRDVGCAATTGGVHELLPGPDAGRGRDS